jgi:hypothetical protein
LIRRAGDLGEVTAVFDGRAIVKAELTQWREVGMTLVCPQCGLAVVIVNHGAREETLMCHTTMTPARPVSCWRVYQPADGAIVAGALYADEQSGITVRCSRPGSGALRCADRRLSQTTARQPGRRTVA